MSTAGKVLIVVIFLAVAGWIYLSASVAELNRNYHEHIAKIEAQAEQARQQAAEARAAFEQARRETALVQTERDRELNRLRGQLANEQRIDSQTRETLDRFNLQATSVQAQIDSAEARQRLRQQEEAETRKELADTRAELDQLASTNDELIDELTSLRNSLVETLEENRAMVERVRRAADGDREANGPTLTRPASAPAR